MIKYVKLLVGIFHIQRAERAVIILFYFVALPLMGRASSYTAVANPNRSEPTSVVCSVHNRTTLSAAHPIIIR